MLISPKYLELNKKLHASNPLYGGEEAHSKLADGLTKLCKQYQTTDVLDYGCGKGSLAHSMPFPIKEYDPAIEGKDTLPEPADIVYCGDVMEHVEPECVDAVLDHIQSLAKKVANFAICCIPALKILDDGRNAHICLESPWWWADKVSKRFIIKIAHVTNANKSIHLYCTPKV